MICLYGTYCPGPWGCLYMPISSQGAKIVPIYSSAFRANGILVRAVIFRCKWSSLWLVGTGAAVQRLGRGRIKDFRMI